MKCEYYEIEKNQYLKKLMINSFCIFSIWTNVLFQKMLPAFNSLLIYVITNNSFDVIVISESRIFKDTFPINDTKLKTYRYGYFQQEVYFYT